QAQHEVELAEHRLRQRIGACALAVDEQPADPLLILGIAPVIEAGRRTGIGPELELMIAHDAADPALHAHTISTSMAPPWPPPMHSVAIPRLKPSRFIALTRCSTMRLPLVPTGWPSDTAPPSTLSRARSIAPAGALRPSTSRQNFSSSHAARQASTCAAKASFSSHSSMSESESCRRLRISVAESTGPKPMIEG